MLQPVAICGLLKKKRRAKPQCWVRPFLTRREEKTEIFLEQLKLDPLSAFKNFSRISCEDFEVLINAISPLIAKQDTNYRKSFPVSIIVREHNNVFAPVAEARLSARTN